MTLIKPYFILANCLLLVFMAYLGVSGVYDMASANLQTMRPQPLSDTQDGRIFQFIPQAFGTLSFH